MQNERLMLAIGRIERALSRIETATRDLPVGAVDDGRTEALKSEMRHAIQTIDRLIAEKEA